MPVQQVLPTRQLLCAAQGSMQSQVHPHVARVLLDTFARAMGHLLRPILHVHTVTLADSERIQEQPIGVLLVISAPPGLQMQRGTSAMRAVH